MNDQRTRKRTKNRLGALFLFGAATGFFFFTFQPWLAFQNVVLIGGLNLRNLFVSFFEASLVGALADWFAVTALFKKPAGLPLPHTDILAKRKDDLAAAVPRFLAGFLKPDSLEVQIRSVDFASHTERFLASGETSSWAGSWLRDRVREIFLQEDSPALDGMIADLLNYLADQFDPALPFGEFLLWAQKEKLDERVIEATVELLRQELLKNRSKLVDPLTALIKKNAGWQGLFVGSGTVEKMLDGVQEELLEIGKNRRHELRAFVSEALTSYSGRLQAPGTAEHRDFVVLFGQTLRNPQFHSRITTWTRALLNHLTADLESGVNSETRLTGQLRHLERIFLEKLGADQSFRKHFNQGLAETLLILLKKTRAVEQLTDSLTDLLKKTEPREFVQRIEDAVWNDLQYIRVNGAVVGGLAGLFLALLQAVLKF